MGRREQSLAAGCERNGRPGLEQAVGGVSGGHADEGVGEGRAISPGRRGSGGVCGGETGAWRAVRREEGSAGSPWVACRKGRRWVEGSGSPIPAVGLVGRDAAQPADRADSAYRRCGLAAIR
ncbi:MAG: hypothetical protein QXQ53_06855 [Candidatus Methanosuratincola sp.]